MSFIQLAKANQNGLFDMIKPPNRRTQEIQVTMFRELGWIYKKQPYPGARRTVDSSGIKI